MIKAIFWDNDGVLVDTESLYFQATAEVLAERGIVLSLEDFIHISLSQGQSALALASHTEIIQGEMDILRNARNERYAALLQNRISPMTGVIETLRKLHSRVRMAIVTGCRKDHFEIIHRQTGLLSLFEFQLVREDYVFSKPHPESYLTALSRTGLQPHECLVIEDSPRGLQAAHAAGIQCWVIPNRLTRNSDFSLAHRVLNRITEVPQLLLGIESPEF